MAESKVLQDLSLPAPKKPDVPSGARSLALAKDNVHLAVAMSDGALKIYDLNTGAARDIRLYAHDSIAEQVSFSPHARLLAVVENSNVRILGIYNVQDGSRIAAIGLSNQPSAKLFPLSNGSGFATVDPSGRIIVHPVFEEPDDFIAYLAKEFPDKLTPAQKRFYFIE
jgi:WD40 repeat protein